MALCRRFWHLLPGPGGQLCRQVIEALDRYAEDETAAREVWDADYALSAASSDDTTPSVYAFVSWTFAEQVAATLQSPPTTALVWAVLYATDATMFRQEMEADSRATHALYQAAEAEFAAAHPTATASEIDAVGAHARAVFCDLIRDIFGNPFRPVTLNPAWRTPAAVALSRQMYDARDFASMPILADALQDAGCEDAAVLDHCRGPGPHVRGGRVVDLLLGKT